MNIKVPNARGEAITDKTPTFSGEIVLGGFSNSSVMDTSVAAPVPPVMTPSPAATPIATPTPSPTPSPSPSPSSNVLVVTVQESMMQDVSGDGTIDWVLPSVPKQPSRTKLYINGQKQVFGSDFVVKGNIVSWLGYQLHEGWRVELYYV